MKKSEQLAWFPYGPDYDFLSNRLGCQIRRIIVRVVDYVDGNERVIIEHPETERRLCVATTRIKIQR